MIHVTFKLFNKIPFSLALISMQDKDRRGRDRVVDGFTTTYAIIAYHHQ